MGTETTFMNTTEFAEAHEQGQCFFEHVDFDNVDFRLFHLNKEIKFKLCTFNKGQLGMFKTDSTPTFLHCVFAETDFSYAYIGKTLFDYCTFNDCNFAYVFMEKTDFVGSIFTGCDFHNAQMDGINLHDVSNLLEIYAPDMSSRSDSLYATLAADGKIMIKAGCWWGTLKQFRKRVKEEYDASHLYMDAANFIAKATKNWRVE